MNGPAMRPIACGHKVNVLFALDDTWTGNETEAGPGPKPDRSRDGGNFDVHYRLRGNLASVPARFPADRVLRSLNPALAMRVRGADE